MTDLPTSTDRATAGIDSLSRGIVYAAFLLAEAIADLDSPYAGALGMSLSFSDPLTLGGDYEATVDIDASIPYSRTDYYLSGGNPITSTLPIPGTSLGTWSGISPPSSPPHIAIGTLPTQVQTLEQFLMYCALEYADQMQTRSLSVLTWSVLSNAPDYPQFSLEMSIPFSNQSYRSSRNLITALLR